MKLFGFKGVNGSESVGALLDKSPDTYVDLCATDPLIPSNLQDLIQSTDSLNRAKTALANANAVTGQIATVTFKAPIEKPG